MGRNELHASDSILDSARAVVIERGVRGATMAAIVQASRAPTGSIYHRFGSLQELLARMWIRAVRSSQAAAMGKLTGGDPVNDVVAAALGTYDFCVSHPDDARLLALFSINDFLGAELPGDIRNQLDTLNAPAMNAAADLSQRIFGTTNRDKVDLVIGCAIDLPYGLVRTHLESGRQPPASRRRAVATAARAVLANHQSSG